MISATTEQVRWNITDLEGLPENGDRLISPLLSGFSCDVGSLFE